MGKCCREQCIKYLSNRPCKNQWGHHCTGCSKPGPRRSLLLASPTSMDASKTIMHGEKKQCRNLAWLTHFFFSFFLFFNYYCLKWKKLGDYEVWSDLFVFIVIVQRIIVFVVQRLMRASHTRLNSQTHAMFLTCTKQPQNYMYIYIIMVFYSRKFTRLFCKKPQTWVMLFVGNWADKKIRPIMTCPFSPALPAQRVNKPQDQT